MCKFPHIFCNIPHFEFILFSEHFPPIWTIPPFLASVLICIIPHFEQFSSSLLYTIFTTIFPHFYQYSQSPWMFTTWNNSFIVDTAHRTKTVEWSDLFIWWTNPKYSSIHVSALKCSLFCSGEAAVENTLKPDSSSLLSITFGFDMEIQARIQSIFKAFWLMY